uniref:Uncharacterized protein n=1 Tax=Arundo donax TaxID=35708 RepID=A0A0A8Y6Q4_ARUDO
MQKSPNYHVSKGPNCKHIPLLVKYHLQQIKDHATALKTCFVLSFQNKDHATG